MPFVSKLQQRWMYANKPAMAERWTHKTKFKSLPSQAKKKVLKNIISKYK